MINIIKQGEDPRQVFRFVCMNCGCIYTATEDECTTILTRGDWLGVELKCPMPFCSCIVRSFEPINKED